jgi:hypothetical protein
MCCGYGVLPFCCLHLASDSYLYSGLWGLMGFGIRHPREMVTNGLFTCLYICCNECLFEFVVGKDMFIQRRRFALRK